jgi:antitoxin CptB
MTNNQIRWQCRRGMLELDLILLKFFDGCFAGLLETEKALFVQFLQESDQTLYRWFMGQELPADPSWVAFVHRIREYAWKP